MNKKFLMYAAAFAAISGTMVSCSEDDTTGDGIFEMKPLSVTLVSNGGDNTSSATKPNRVHSKLTDTYFMNYWTQDDAIYVWSSEETTLNKLVGSENANDKQRMVFSSQACKYQDNKRMAMLYVGNQSLTVNDDSEFTLSRGDNDNNLALVYGTGNLHYSDRNNPFVLKVSSSKAADGKLSGTDGELTLKDAVAKLRIGMPAKDANDANLLAKLKYEITVSYKQVDVDGENVGSGFPSSMKYEISIGKKVGSSNAYKIFADDSWSELTWGNALKLTYDPNSTDENARPSVLWNTTENTSADYLKGYVFVPLPIGYYSELSVSVSVTNPNNVDGVSDFCKTYSYKWEQGTSNAVSVDLGSQSNQFYGLPDMWTRE